MASYFSVLFNMSILGSFFRLGFVQEIKNGFALKEANWYTLDNMREAPYMSIV